MAASLIGWIWQESIERDISTGARLTLFALSEHANIGEHGDWRVYPSQERVARMVGCTPKSLRKYLTELVESELLTLAHQHDEAGRQLPNLYWLMAPKYFEGEGGKDLPTRGGKNYLHGGENFTHKSLNKNPLIGTPASSSPEKKIPVQEIVALYHQLLPMLPPVRKLTKAREGYIKQRWREGDLPDLEVWEKYFGYVSQSKFLTGGIDGRDGKPPFRADLEWITKPANYAKIFEGKYHV